MNKDEEIEKLLVNLNNSKFRGSFHLNQKMKEYVNKKGIKEIEKHAYDIIEKRLKPAMPKNDGKQTPMKQVHPIFIAQHACGFCCRGCLERIHKIPKNYELTNNQINYIVKVMLKWIKREMKNEK